jgi:hypothetical protein
METDRELIHDLAIIHMEGEGDWCLTSESHVGEDK